VSTKLSIADQLLPRQGFCMQTAILILAVPFGILTLLLASGALYQAIGTARDRRRFPPPGRLVRVNNRRMHIRVTGEGAPAVVFESGMGASCLSWTLVEPGVGQFCRTVSYDRAGHGWSDPAHEPRTAQQIATELHALLNAAGVPRPYVLVAHSFGGYVSRVFAHLYCNDVVGLVLVDSIHPAEWENPTVEQWRMIRLGSRYIRIATWLARVGVVRFCLARVAGGSPRLARAAASAFGAGVSSAVERIAGEIRKLPVPMLPMVRGFWSQPRNFLALEEHIARLPVSAAQAAAVNSLGDVPLVVLSGDHHQAPYADWQRDLARLSSCGVQVVAGDSGHWIHLDRPDLVTRVIREVVAVARSRVPTEDPTQTLQP
jgi:pimeloyl-ACP methyl ester carboxylesterase